MSGVKARTRLLIVFLLGVAVSAVVVVLILGAVNSAATRKAQKTNSPKISQTAETLATVKSLAEKIDSCTDPDGACAKRGRRQTAAVVADISVRQIAAVACADQPGTQPAVQIKACVDRTMRVIAATRHRQEKP